MAGRSSFCRAAVILPLFVLLLAVMAGCEAGNLSDESSSIMQPGSAQQPESVPQAVEKREFDLSGGGWKAYEEIENSSEIWSASAYWDDFAVNEVPADAKNEMHYSAVDGDDLYILKGYDTGEEPASRRYCLMKVNMLSLKAERVELNLQGLRESYAGDDSALTELMEAAESGRAWVTDMDVIDGRVYLLLPLWEDGKTVYTYVLRLNGSGEIEGMTDLLPGIEQSGILQPEGSEHDYMPISIVCDKEGRSYIASGVPGTGICVLDENGNFAGLLAASDGRNIVSEYVCRLPEGQPVFEVCDQDSQRVTFLCLEEGREKILYRGEGMMNAARYINAYGEIVWLASNGILRWNAAEGKCQRFYKNHGIKAGECEAVKEGPDGEIALVCFDGAVTSIHRIRQGENEEQTELRIFSFGGNQALEELAADYNRKHPDTTVVVETGESGEDRDILLNRLMIRMQSGEGPDILVLSRKQLEILQSKGMLADLSDMIQEETREQIFAGVLQQGMIENRLYGISGRVSISTLLVPKDVWEGDTWTFQDVLSLLEQREKSGAPCDSFDSTGSSQMLYELTSMDLERINCFLADPEKGKSCFDHPEFIKLLEACKRYGNSDEYKTPEERLAEVEAGKALALYAGGDLKGFSSVMAMAGEGWKCVGYPTEGENGTRVTCYELMAVNAGTQRFETAADFLNYLLSGEVQRRKMTTGTVRRDVLTAGVEVISEGPVFKLGGRMVTPLEGKPDGDSWLQEYMDLLDQGVPMAEEYSEIEMIMTEEAAAFFSGDKDAAEAAEIVQSRVQLYLDERK